MSNAPLHTREAANRLADACKALSDETGLTITSGYLGGNLERPAYDHRIWYVWVKEATVPHWGGGRNTLFLGFAAESADEALGYCTLEHLDKALGQAGVLPATIQDWRLDIVSTTKQSADAIAAYKAIRGL